MKHLTALALVLSTSATVAHADAEACKTVRLADLGWTDIMLTDATAGLLLEALGYEPSETLLGLDVAYVSLREGDMDIFQGNWRPVQDENYQEFFDKGWVEDLGENLTGAKYTLAVPSYVSAKGVTSFSDVAANPDMFGGKIYGIEPGSNAPLLQMIEEGRYGFDKDWQVVESSEAGMLVQVQRAIAREEPVVFMGWEPHPMNINYELTYLSGGEAEYGENYGGSTVHTLARPGFTADCPNVAKLFSQLRYTLDYENYGMRLMVDDGALPEDAARAMIAEMPELLDIWLEGVTTFAGQNGMDAVTKALVE